MEAQLHRPVVKMDPLTTAAASGLQARMDSIDMLANNMANSSSSGFKVDREVYSTFNSTSPWDAFDPSVGDAPVVENRWTDFAQGPLVQTGNLTDLGLSGSGFFAVNGPNGPLYTRNGSFRISPNGTLTTAEGYPVRQVGGQPIQLQTTDPIDVSPEGEVSQQGQLVGQIEIRGFADQSQLTKLTSGYFVNPDPKTIIPAAAPDTQVSQGRLEASNTTPAESAARMISLMRNFEMLQHAVKIGTEMNREAIEEVAKVAS